MNNKSTIELKGIINGVALYALHSRESARMDDLCDAAHEELSRREEERGELVRLSNKTKSMCGPAYILGYEVDGIVTRTWYETDLIKAKAARRVM